MSDKISIALFIVLTLAVAGLFFPFPDLDITLLTIKYHRFFLFHSVILPVILYLIMLKIRRKIIINVASIFLSGFSLGVSLHLLTDIIPQKAVNFLVVNTLVPGTYLDDRLWIIGNMLLGFILVALSFRKYSTSKLTTGDEKG